MGDIKAQRVELIRTTQSQITPELVGFSCDLRQGTKLTFQLSGSDPNVLKPHGGTFGWGVRLTQEIG